MMVNADRRVAVVTGASSRLGRIAVGRLQRSGYYVCGLDAEGAAGDRVFAVDLTDRGALQRVIAQIHDELGGPQAVVTTCGHCDAAPFGELPSDSWERLLREQLGGAVNACATALPFMIATGTGRIVITVPWLSLAGRSGEAYFAAATGSLLAFTKSLALEVAPAGIRVNGLIVGPYAGSPEEPIDGWDESCLVADSLTAAAETIHTLTDEDDGDFFVGQLFTPVAGGVV